MLEQMLQFSCYARTSCVSTFRVTSTSFSLMIQEDTRKEEMVKRKLGDRDEARNAKAVFVVWS